MPEKIVTAFQTVHDEQVNEEAVLNKCKTAVQHVGKLEVDAGNTSGEGKRFAMPCNSVCMIVFSRIKLVKLYIAWHFFDRKRQRNILIKRKYKRRMMNPPTKEKQDYK